MAQSDDDEIDPADLLAALIECVADGLPNRDTDVPPVRMHPTA